MAKYALGTCVPIIKGFRNIDASQKNENNPLMSGFNLLLKDIKCNLGWRLVAQNVYKKQKKEDRFKEILIVSKTTNEQFSKLIDKDERKLIKEIIASLRKISNNDKVTDEECMRLLNYFEYNPTEMITSKLQDDLEQSHKVKNIYRDTPIKITSILGSKGLTKDYTFLVNFEDRYLLDHEKVTDDSICKFLVALTRTRRRCYIYTSADKMPTFVNWIGSEFEEI